MVKNLLFMQYTIKIKSFDFSDLIETLTRKGKDTNQS